MIKHGPHGPSFQKRMRAAFGEKSQIYGFSDVAPLGNQVETYFSNYFDKAAQNAGGDYSQHLEQRLAQRTIANIEKGEKALGKIGNSAWSTEMSLFSNIHCGGLERDDPNNELQKELCFLYDKNLHISSKVEQSLKLISKQGSYREHFPAIAKFFKENYLDIINSDSTQFEIEKMKNNPSVRANLYSLLNTLKKIDPNNKFAATKIDILTMQHTLGHLKEPSKVTLQREVKQLLKKNGKFIQPNLVNRRLLCSLSHTGVMKMEVTADEFDSSLKSPEGILAMNCFQTKDKRITNMAEELINKQSHSELKQKYILKGLADLPGSENIAIFKKLAKDNLNSTDKYTQVYANNVLLRSANKGERELAASTMLKTNSPASIAYLQEHLASGQFGASELVAQKVTQILNSSKTSNLSGGQKKNLARVLAHTAQSSDKKTAHFLASSFARTQQATTDTFIKQMAENKLHSPIITDRLLLNLKNKILAGRDMTAVERSIGFYLDGANLNEKQINEINSIKTLLNNNFETYGYLYIKDLLSQLNTTKSIQRCNKQGLNGTYCK